MHKNVSERERERERERELQMLWLASTLPPPTLDVIM